MYTQTSGHKFNVSKIAEGFGNSLSALFSPDNANAAMYSFLSAGLGLYSLVLLFGSHEVCCFAYFVALILSLFAIQLYLPICELEFL